MNFNTEQLSKADLLNIRMVKHFGWVNIDPSSMTGCLPGTNPDMFKVMCEHIPSYASDLNLIQRETLKLKKDQRDRVARNLTYPYAGPRGSGERMKGGMKHALQTQKREQLHT